MKRLAIFIGGLLVLPAFAEVAPIFINEEDATEYVDAMYDENGFLIIPDEEVIEETNDVAVQKNQTPVKISRAPVNATPIANRSTSTRAVPSTGRANTSGRGTATGNSSRVVAARTTTNSSGRGNTSRAVASRGTINSSPRTTATTSTTRTTTNTAATRAAAARTTGGSARSANATSSGSGIARTATTAGRTATAARAGTARSTTTARVATDPSRLSIRGNVGAGVKAGQIGTPMKVNGVVADANGMSKLYNESKSASIRRTPTLRMSTLNNTSVDANTISMSMEDMDDLAEMTDYCKAQYANCMDNYCNVLDDNQGRCSCSANLKNYAKAEAALKTATEELQDVAQKIQYIGLTTREVETLFTQTEAELAMQSKTDNSQLKASLDKVKNMIVDVKTGNATSDVNTGLNFDLSGLLEFSFDSTGFDLMSLFGTSNTGSVSNQRGEELYKTASSRCKTSVIKACTARGVDASLITNAYDLEIDRECIMYERSLNDSNDEMLATVRNAKNVLQKARLMVAQQKNAYDMRGCINALDSCMQDEFVCGSDYENCLDPTGRYIVNGEIVIGSQPGHAIDPEISSRVASVMTSDVCRVNLYRTWDFPNKTCREHGEADYLEPNQTSPNYMSRPTYDQGNAWGSGTGDNLVAYIEETVTANAAKNASENMSQYLQNKIGYVNQKDGRAYGMCISVLNKCQDYTYTGKGTSAKYNPQNDVIKQYLGRVLVQIKSKQDEILASYAETCVSDVTSCLSQNGYPSEDPSEWGASTSTEYITNVTKTNIAINACRAQVVTCMSVNGYSIDTPTPTEMNCWVQGLLFNYTTEDCLAYHSSTVSCGPTTRRFCNSDNCESQGGGYWCVAQDSCLASEDECNNSNNGCMVTFQRNTSTCGGTATSTSMSCTNNVGPNFSSWGAGSSKLNWTCNNSTLQSALNSLGGGTGIGTLGNLAGYNISATTTCTANCISDETNLTLTVNCGNGATFYGGSAYTNMGSSGRRDVSQGANINLPGSLCNSDGSNAQCYSCSGGSTVNAGDNVTIGAGSQTCVANYTNCDGTEPENYIELTINCGNGVFNKPSSDPAGVYTVAGAGGSGTGQNPAIGKFRSRTSTAFDFILDGSYCSPNTNTTSTITGYTCGGTSYNVGDTIVVSSTTTCNATYGSGGAISEAVVICLDKAAQYSTPVNVVNQVATFNKDTCPCGDGTILTDYTTPYCRNCNVIISGNTVTVSGINEYTEILPVCSNPGGHTFTATCGTSCTKINDDSIIISTGQNINLNSYCTVPSGGNISWSCGGQTLDSFVRLQMPDHDYSCTATCTGGGNGGDNPGGGNEGDEPGTQKVNLTLDCGVNSIPNLKMAALDSTFNRQTYALNSSYNLRLDENLCTTVEEAHLTSWKCAQGNNLQCGNSSAGWSNYSQLPRNLTIDSDYTCCAQWPDGTGENSVFATYRCKTNSINGTLNSSVLQSSYNTSQYKDQTVNETAQSYSFTTTGDNIVLAPANACTCPNGGEVTAWINNSAHATRGTGNSYLPGSSLNVQTGWTYVFTPECSGNGGSGGGTGETQQDCSDNGGTWCSSNNQCYYIAEDYFNGCGQTEDACDDIGGAWCAGTCHPAGYICNESNCENNGGHWCALDGNCYDTLAQYNANCTVSVTVDCGAAGATLNKEGGISYFTASVTNGNTTSITNYGSSNGTVSGDKYTAQIPVGSNITTTYKVCNCPGLTDCSGFTYSMNNQSLSWNGSSFTTPDQPITFTAVCPEVLDPATVTIDCNGGANIGGNTTTITNFPNLVGDQYESIFNLNANLCTPPSNKTQSGWICGADEEVVAVDNSFPVTPGENITCTAQWQGTTPSQYKVDSNCSDCGGSNQTGSYAENDSVTLTCGSGINVTNWSCKKAEGNHESVSVEGGTFTMPGFPVACTATCSGSTPQYNFSSITLQGASI